MSNNYAYEPMTPDKLRQLIESWENPKVDFKAEIDGLSFDGNKINFVEIKKAEFVKDIISLTNGNSAYNLTFSKEPAAHLIIGVIDKEKEKNKELGLNDLLKDTAELSNKLNKTWILSIVNPYLVAPIGNLEAEFVEINNKKIFVITIPPQPYLLELSKDLKAKGKNFTQGSVIIRIGESTKTACDAEREALKKLKAAQFTDYYASRTDPEHNPFLGLLSFTEKEQARFYGRNEEIRQLYAKIMASRTVIVLGPSGIGKSSLIQAGLFPELRKCGDWQLLLRRPSNWRDNWLEKLPAWIESQRQSGHNVLLAVDQFEELFQLETKEQNGLIDALINAANACDDRVIVGLRADFLDKLSGDWYQKADCFVVKPIADCLLPDMLEKTAAPVEFQAGLVERIIRELKQSSGASAQVSLPLLQFTLRKLWDSGALTSTCYDKLGAQGKALAAHAEEKFNAFSLSEQTTLKHLLVLKLANLSGQEATRQLLHRQDASDEEWRLLQMLAEPDKRLITINTPEDAQPTAELVHEAILRHWSRLTGWLKQHREFKLWHSQDFLGRFQDWQNSGEDDAELLKRNKLASALEFLERYQDWLSEDEKHFIEKSQQTQERTKRRNQGAVLFSVLLLLIWIASIYFQWQNAEQATQRAEAAQLEASKQREEAQAERDEALRTQSLFLADLARQKLEKGEVFTAMRLALEALPNSSESSPHRPFVWEAQDSLYNAVLQHQRGFLEHKDGIQESIFSPDGQILLVRAYENAYLWDVKTGKRIAVLHHDLSSPIEAQTSWRAIFSPDGSYIATDLFALTIWDSKTGEKIFSFPLDISLQEFSPNGNFMLARNKKKFVVINVKTGEQPHSFEGEFATFSPDGKWIANLDANGSVYLLEAQTGEIYGVLSGILEEGRRKLVRFSHNGKYLAVLNEKSSSLWNLENIELIGNLKGGISVYLYLSNKVFSTSTPFSPDGERFLTINKGRVNLFNSATGQLIKTLSESSFYAIFSSTGKYILTISDSIKLWDSHTGNMVLNLGGYSYKNEPFIHKWWGYVVPFFSYEDSYLVVDSSLYNLNDRENKPLTFNLSGSINDITFSPVNNILAASSSNGIVKLINGESNTLRGIQKNRFSYATSDKIFFYQNKPVVIRFENIKDTGCDIEIIDFYKSTALKNINLPNKECSNVRLSGSHIIISSEPDTIKFFDLEKSTYTFHIKTKNIFTFSASKNRNKIATQSNCKVKVWDISSGTLVKSIIYNNKPKCKGSHGGHINFPKLNNEGNKIIVAHTDRKGRLNEAVLHDLTTEHSLSLGRKIRDAKFSPNNKFIALIHGLHGEDKKLQNTVKIIDANTGSKHTDLRHLDTVTDIAFSSDSRLIATASMDLTAKIWDVSTGKLIKIVADSKQHKNTLGLVKFSPDDQLLLTGEQSFEAPWTHKHYDANTVLWDIKTGSPFFRLWDNHRVYKAKFNAMGTQLIINNSHLYPIFTSEGLISYAQDIIFEPFSCEERRQYFLPELPRCQNQKTTPVEAKK
jgi:WD40 repeat protein